MNRFLLRLVVLLACAGAFAQQPVEVTDGVNGNVAVKPAATQPALADKAHVVGISPNNGGLPVNLLAVVQKTNQISSGSVASINKAFTSNVTAGNSIIVSFCNGNNNLAASPVSDGTNTYTKAVLVANGSAFECGIFYALNVAAGATTITITPGGSNASIAMEIYEVSGPIQQIPAQADVTTSNTGSSATASATAISPMAPNATMFSAVGVGTAAQTITVGTNWTNDSGQQNPTTPAGLFSFVGMSQQLDDEQAIQPSATFTSEPWAIVAAVFHAPILPVGGVFRRTDGTNFEQVDPCKGQTKSYLSISETANTQLVAGTTSKKIYVCSIHVVTATAQNIALVEGTGSTCATGTAGVQGFGGSTAATGWNFAANGGISYGDGSAALGAEGTAADNLCLFQSGSGQVSGGLSYVVQ